MRLYQVLDPRRMHQPEGVKLLDFRRISAMSHGWEVFKVKDTIQDWVNDTARNFGERVGHGLYALSGLNKDVKNVYRKA